MKKYIFTSVCAAAALFMAVSCASTDVPVTNTQPEVPAVEEPAPVPVAEPAPKNEEYERSTGNVDISIEEFNEDKRQILAIIAELDDIMKSMNYSKWVTYLDQESINYWSNKSNLQKAASRLPVKGLRLSTLEDYFKYIFISSRVGRRVDEIRYETSTIVKAVQVNDESDTVYYHFSKVNGEWKLHLPPLAD